MLAAWGIVAALASPAFAHVAMYHESMFGWDDTAGNQMKPLREIDNFGVEEWFGHGYKDHPPAAGKILELPSSGNVQLELSCGRRFTTMCIGALCGAGPQELVCDMPDINKMSHGKVPHRNGGASHSQQDPNQPIDPSLFGGTALAIAYTSDVHSLNPEDMTVISVNSTSPWERVTNYNLPRLPACPPGGCICSWNWIHVAENVGIAHEIYNLLYRCDVTNPDDSVHIPKGTPPMYCENDQSQCVKGAKQPMYIWQKSGNNMDGRTTGDSRNPSYNPRYGYTDGAQDDAPVDGPGANVGSNGATSPEAPTVSGSTNSTNSVSGGSGSATGSAGPTATSPTGPTQTTISSDDNPYAEPAAPDGAVTALPNPAKCKRSRKRRAAAAARALAARGTRNAPPARP